MATPKRISKHWTPGPEKVVSVDHTNITETNLVNNLLVLKQEDVTFSFIMKLFGSFDGKSLCHPYDTFDVPANTYYYTKFNGKTVSNTQKFTTTIGIWIFNVVFLQGFGYCDIVGGYVNETITAKKFDQIHQQIIYALMEDKIEVAGYKEFLNYTQFFMPFETILSPNHTEAVLTCTKEINKKKQELYNKYKKEIDAGNEVVAEKMEQELLAYAKELLGDDPGLDPMLSGAGGNFNNNFKNIFVMKGAIRDVDPNAKQNFNIALSNWADGISADEYSVVANSLAGGPYSRAKKTEIGGYWEKLITAAFSTVRLDPPGSDCGTKDYIEVLLDESNISGFMYSYIIKSDGSLEELTTDTKDKYIGKKVKMRFATKCKSKTGFCHHCAGNFFYRRSSGKNPNVGVSMAQIGSNIKLKSMKAFHDSTIQTTTVDPFKMFGLRKIDS